MDEFAQDTLTEEQYEEQQHYNTVLDSLTDEEQDMLDEMLTHEDDLEEWLLNIEIGATSVHNIGFAIYPDKSISLKIALTFSYPHKEKRIIK